MRKIKLCIVLLTMGCLAAACGSKNSGQNDMVENGNQTGEVSSETANFNALSIDELQEKGDETCNEFNSGQKSYTEAKNYLTELRDGLETEDKKSIITDAINKVDSLNDSKEAYAEGLKNMEKDDINYVIDAITLFREVEEEDTCYEDAQKNLENLIEKYNEFMLGIAEEYIADGDYISAINQYDDMIAFIGDYDGLQAQKEMTVSAYIDACIADAEAFMVDDKFTEAKNCIDKCIENVGSNTALENEKDRIQNFTPISLMELDSFWQEEESIYISEWETDDVTNLGEKGYTGIKFRKPYTLSPGYDGKATISYMIDGNYNTITGIFALHEDFKNETRQENAMMLSIYGDDVLLYQSNWLYGGVLPMDLCVDISGVKELTIVCTGTLYRDIVGGLINPELRNKYVPLNTNINSGIGSDGNITEGQ